MSVALETGEPGVSATGGKRKRDWLEGVPHLKTIEQLDEILSKVAERAETSTAIIKSTPVERRLPPLD